MSVIIMNSNHILKYLVIMINNKGRCKYVFNSLILIIFCIMIVVKPNKASHLNERSSNFTLTSNTTNQRTNNDSIIIKQIINNNNNNNNKAHQSMNNKSIITTPSRIINNNNKNRDDNKDNNIQLYNLVLKDDSSSKYGKITDQIARHNYNISTVGNSSPTPVGFILKPPTNNKTISNSNQTNEEQLETSDSRFFPSRISPRSSNFDDDDTEPVTPDEETNNNYSNNDNLDQQRLQDDFEVFFDGVASSNLNEQKVVKELTKMLSKGLSGATNQVRLDTLESWRKKQKERKVVKDNRAKLFEDLLTAAISSHPEKVRRSKGSNNSNKKKKVKTQQSSQLSSYDQADYNSQKTITPSPITGFVGEADQEANVDPDAVLQQLQGLAALMEANGINGASSLASGSYNQHQMSANDDGLSPDPISTLFDNLETAEPASTTEDSYSSSLDNGENINQTKTKKKSASSITTTTSNNSERPIVKQFKKIKRRISLRKKQLEQVKKMFDVDLAINPKDGSLMGKPASEDKKQNQPSDSSSINVQEVGDYTVIDDHSGAQSRKHKSSSSGSGSNSSKNRKMKELMSYLKDNPEILASVMSELTTDSDPARTSFSQPTNLSNMEDDINRDQYHDSLMDRGEQMVSSNIGARHLHKQPHNNNNNNNNNYTKRNAFNRNNNNYTNDDPSSFSTNWEKVRAKSLNGRLSIPTNDVDQNSSSYQSKSSNDKFNLSELNRYRTAENLLLESLRDRQLMNLARLEMVLAERQQASSRSSTFTTLNNSTKARLSQQQSNNQASSLGSINSNNIDPNHQRADLAPEHLESNNQQYNNSVNQQQTQNRQQSSSQNNTKTNQDSDDFVHHFMTMNAKPNELPTMNKWLSGSYLNNSNNNTSNNQNNSNNNNNGKKQQQQQPALGRFKSWRDVSQSEAASSYQRNDKTNSIPYDLTTGSSSSTTSGSELYRDGAFNQAPNSTLPRQLAQATMPMTGAQFNNNIQQQQLTYFPNFASQNYQQKSFGDSIVTRPGPLMPTPIASLPTYVNPFQNLNPFLTPSAFMTRSSVVNEKTVPAPQGSLSTSQHDTSTQQQSQLLDFYDSNSNQSNNSSSILTSPIVSGPGINSMKNTRQQSSFDIDAESKDEDGEYDISTKKQGSDNSNMQKISSADFGNLSNELYANDQAYGEGEQHYHQANSGRGSSQQRQPVNYFKAYKNELQQSSDESGTDERQIQHFDNRKAHFNENLSKHSSIERKKRTKNHYQPELDNHVVYSSNNHKLDVDPDEDDGLGAMWAKSRRR